MRLFRPKFGARARLLLLCGLLAISAAASAYTLEEFHFTSPEQEEQFRVLIGKLRCLVCQNESLAASQAELAQDLRQEVYGMMREGRSQEEILAFLTDRYGDFVLYDPPLKPSTYVLWFGPFVLIAIAAFFMIRSLLRSRAGPPAELSENERQRLQQLLDTDSSVKDETS
ncbi:MULTISPECIES: cytochrome c-type biogenesis protein [Thiorhodovibrio]|uniref:cytochrome c-type biogenesis protein n=1 Tax=Thiorhodovibrio TaxID=61593 RepID=UPI001912956D|nr:MULTISPECIES: cytochrome c-type biogenesis protein [Thiorhodovibrio]MBK5968743.1 cytochrome C biogenesis protein [Thiorhodovibrio winogradskyi]WPL10901.1 Cytochrome c-type biogenesis protein CcmH precursor [Thiorhodovibrio litoralis]